MAKKKPETICANCQNPSNDCVEVGATWVFRPDRSSWRIEEICAHKEFEDIYGSPICRSCRSIGEFDPRGILERHLADKVAKAEQIERHANKSRFALAFEELE